MIFHSLFKNFTSNSRLECKTYTRITTKMDKIDTLFLTKTDKKPFPLGPHTYILYNVDKTSLLSPKRYHEHPRSFHMGIYHGLGKRAWFSVHHFR